MPQVLCAVDGSPASEAAVREAVAYCRRRRAALGLVGLVREPRLAAPQPAVGERTRGFLDVQYRLVHAARAARRAGLAPTIALRQGESTRELLAEAREVGAELVFLPRSQSRIAALRGRPPQAVDRIWLRPARHLFALERAA